MTPTDPTPDKCPYCRPGFPCSAGGQCRKPKTDLLAMCDRLDVIKLVAGSRTSDVIIDINLIDRLIAAARRPVELEARLREVEIGRERLAWNLGGCLTIAESQTPTTYSKELALPAIDAVNRVVTELKRLQAVNLLHQQKSNGEYWAWQGDDEDHVESLVCPVLIPSSVLRGLLAAPTGGEGGE